MKKISALAFRGLGISGRFILIFLITKNVSLEFQGEFSLISTNAAILVMLISFELYTYTNQILVMDKNKATFVFKNSLFFFAFCYLLLIPISTVFLEFELISSDIFFAFVMLVICEHLAQELFRIYLAIEKPVFANFLYFLRAGTWSWIIAILLLLGFINDISIHNILLSWAIGAFTSVLIGVLKLPLISGFFKEKIDLKLLKKALRFSSVIMLSTLFLKTMEYSDRYFIDYFLSKKELGIYMFFFQLTNLVNIIIFTLYISFVYPQIMKDVLNKNKKGYVKTKLILNKKIILIVIAFILIYSFILPFVIDYLEKPELYENRWLLLLMLISCLILNISYASHYFLITEKKENVILRITAISAISNVLINCFLIPIFGIYGAAISLFISSLLTFFFKNKSEHNSLNKWPL